jgi:hypothetical protein
MKNVVEHKNKSRFCQYRRCRTIHRPRLIAIRVLKSDIKNPKRFQIIGEMVEDDNY